MNDITKELAEIVRRFRLYTDSNTSATSAFMVRVDAALELYEHSCKPETLTLKQLLKKWEIDFSAKWENPKNRSSELYEEEVERFIQMFTEWMPDAIGGVQDDWNDGYNSCRHTVMENLK